MESLDQKIPTGNQIIEINSTEQLGEVLCMVRKSQKLTQKDIAGLGNTGNRLIVDIENGKPTVQIQKVLHVLDLLGLKMVVKRKGI